MTVAQRYRLVELLEASDGTALHHGDCVGADAGAHGVACDLGLQIVIHPPKNGSARAFCRPAREMRPPLPYLDRNKRIVDATECLVAAPATKVEELRSGTWSTVRYARKLKRPIWIIYPDGSYTEENQQ